MRKSLQLVLLLVLIVSSGCGGGRELVVYNGCKGTWMRIREGSNVIIDRLEEGRERVLEVSGWGGRTVQLFASAFSTANNAPVGSASIQISIPTGSGGLFAGPSDLQPWKIYSLDNGSCRQ